MKSEKCMYDCGGCTYCCKVMKIHELDKPGNTWCSHCEIGVGCKTYETRPESCRTYECVWLLTQKLSKPISHALRPDKSRVVIGTTNQGEELVFYVTPERPNAWQQKAFKSLVDELLGKGKTLYVSCEGTLKKL